jgi:iron complex transport system substrate-binding protein
MIGIPLTLIALAAIVFPFARGGFRKPTEPNAPGDMRIVSLAPSVTEMLFLLDLQKSIVGVTDWCDYPPEAKQIERLGALGKPSMEKLLALSPTLVVVGGFDRKDSLESLRSSGIEVVEIKIDVLADLFKALRKIGEATGRRDKAEEVVAEMQATLARDALPNDQRKNPPKVFVEIWDDPLTTIGSGSFLDDVIAHAGGVNVAHEIAQPHPRINAEKVIEWNPDVIIVSHMARTSDSAAEVANRIGWSDIAAVKRRKIICDIPHDLILRPGPRLIEGVSLLARRLREEAEDTANTSSESKSEGGRP